MSSAQNQQWLQQAVAHHQAGRLEAADALYRRIRAAAPRNFDAFHLSGVVALQQGRAADACTLLEQAARLGPKSAVCLMRLGLACLNSGRTAESEAYLRRALGLDPNGPEIWDNLAYCLKTQDRLTEAIQCHQRSVALNPGYAIGWYNYGLTLSLYGQSAEALQCHERALAADPRYARALFGKAQALQQLNRLTEAVGAYGRFLEAEPSHHEARSYRLFALNYLENVDRSELFAEHLAFGAVLGESPPPDFPHEPDPDRRLRVALISPDLRAHSCAYFIEPLVRHLDKAGFELYLYHDHFREDAVSQRLQQHAAVWRRFVGQPGPAVEAAIRADQPDILIDLAGHTGMTSRLPLFARHLAPVQITYLGYPNTTGVAAMGYRLTDEIADPTGEADAFATERLVRFAPTAWAYEPSATAPEISPAPCLAGGGVTFGCYNNIGKVTDAMLATWGRLLRSVPGSRLVLKGRGLGDESSRQLHLARFDAAELPEDRVVFLERTADTNDHLKLYSQVDISLDTHPYNGTTTTCEALWMGVPVITLLGDRHASRVSASLLTAAGHPEWIATTTDDYVRIAAELAANPARLAEIRSGLRDDMRRSAMLDHAGQAQRFGAALRACWRDWCAQPAPGAPAEAALCAGK